MWKTLMGGKEKIPTLTSNCNSTVRVKTTTKLLSGTASNKSKPTTMTTMTRLTRSQIKAAINQKEKETEATEEDKKNSSKEVTNAVMAIEKKVAFGRKTKAKNNIAAFWKDKKAAEEKAAEAEGIQAATNEVAAASVEATGQPNKDIQRTEGGNQDDVGGISTEDNKESGTNTDDEIWEQPNMEVEKWEKVQSKKSVNTKEQPKQTTKVNPIKPLPLQSAWTCTISPTYRKEDMQVYTIVRGILAALHQIDPNIHLTKIGGKDYPAKAVTKPEETPKDKGELEEYAEEPHMTSSNKLTFRITLASQSTIDDIITNQGLVKWMKKTKLSMGKSTIKTSKPAFVGFYDEPNPERKKIYYLEERIKAIMGERTIEYQVVIKPIFVEGKGCSAMVYMVIADKADVTQLRTILRIETHITSTFFPWDQYSDLPREKKLHIIQTQQKLNLHLRSVLAFGFTNNIPTIDFEFDDDSEKSNDFESVNMEQLDETQQEPNNDEKSWDEEDDFENDEQTNNQIQMTQHVPANLVVDTDVSPAPIMTEFIIDHFRGHQGESIFPKVWGPLNGKILLFYNVCNQNQALAITTILKPEIAKHMTETCIRIVFEEPDEVIQQSYQTAPWEPYDLAMEVPSAEAMEQTEKTKHEQTVRKRFRSSTYSITESAGCQPTQHGNSTQTYNNSPVEIEAEIRQPQKASPNPNVWAPRPNNNPTAAPTKQSTKTVENSSQQNDYSTLLSDVEQICTKLIQESQDKIIEQTEHQLNQMRIETSGTTKRLDQNIKDIKKGVDKQFAKADDTQHKTLTKIFENQDKMMAMLLNMQQGHNASVAAGQCESPETTRVHNAMNSQLPTSRPGSPMTDAVDRKRTLHSTPQCEENDDGTTHDWGDTPHQLFNRTAPSIDSSVSCDGLRPDAAGTQ
jgi:hypothetical protein